MKKLKKSTFKIGICCHTRHKRHKESFRPTLCPYLFNASDVRWTTELKSVLLEKPTAVEGVKGTVTALLRTKYCLWKFLNRIAEGWYLFKVCLNYVQ